MRTDSENKQGGWSFESDWFSKWHEFSWPITEHSELNQSNLGLPSTLNW